MATHTKGILKPRDAAQHFSIKRYTPAASLRGIIQHYWIVRWDLPVGRTYESKTLAYPAVNIVVSEKGVAAGGPTLTTFSYTLSGRGVICGVLFTPAGFSALFDGSLATLTNTQVPVASIPILKDVQLQNIHKANDADAVAHLDGVFGKLSLRLGDKATWMNGVFETIRSDRSITRVASLCGQLGVSERTLQQLFRRCVGVTPKWAIMRYRMQDVADILYTHPERQLSDIAMDFGYVDQAHLSRDFKRIIGVSPLHYRRSQQ